MKKAATAKSTIFLTCFMLSPWCGVLRWSQLLPIVPKAAPRCGEARRRTCSHDPIQTVSGISEAGHDVPALVELLVDRTGNDADGDVEVGRGRLEPCDALGRRQQGDRGDVVGAQVDQ